MSFPSGLPRVAAWMKAINGSSVRTGEVANAQRVTSRARPPSINASRPASKAASRIYSPLPGGFPLVVEGRAGDDVVEGRAGDDVVEGRAGDDVVEGRAGDERKSADHS